MFLLTNFVLCSGIFCSQNPILPTFFQRAVHHCVSTCERTSAWEERQSEGGGTRTKRHFCGTPFMTEFHFIFVQNQMEARQARSCVLEVNPNQDGYTRRHINESFSCLLWTSDLLLLLRGLFMISITSSQMFWDQCKSCLHVLINQYKNMKPRLHWVLHKNSITC